MSPSPPALETRQVVTTICDQANFKIVLNEFARRSLVQTSTGNLVEPNESSVKEGMSVVTNTTTQQHIRQSSEAVQEGTPRQMTLTQSKGGESWQGRGPRRVMGHGGKRDRHFSRVCLQEGPHLRNFADVYLRDPAVFRACVCFVWCREKTETDVLKS